ncbi:MAG: hypothetical protein ACTSPL_04165 [Candidatus Odinarchaeia archaeon]
MVKIPEGIVKKCVEKFKKALNGAVEFDADVEFKISWTQMIDGEDTRREVRVTIEVEDDAEFEQYDNDEEDEYDNEDG